MNSQLPSLDDCIHLTTLHIGSHSIQSSGSISFESISWHLLSLLDFNELETFFLGVNALERGTAFSLNGTFIIVY